MESNGIEHLQKYYLNELQAGRHSINSLVNIWSRNEVAKYSEDHIKAIELLLKERGVVLPNQSRPRYVRGKGLGYLIFTVILVSLFILGFLNDIIEIILDPAYGIKMDAFLFQLSVLIIVFAMAIFVSILWTKFNRYKRKKKKVSVVFGNICYGLSILIILSIIVASGTMVGISGYATFFLYAAFYIVLSAGFLFLSKILVFKKA
jgi:hypothetical protein